MLSRISVSTLLKSVIAVLGAAIVVMLALSARDSWARLNAADRISGVAPALAEENSATAKTLEQQSQDMQERIASFQLDSGDAPAVGKARNAA